MIDESSLERVRSFELMERLPTQVQDELLRRSATVVRFEPGPDTPVRSSCESHRRPDTAVRSSCDSSPRSLTLSRSPDVRCVRPDTLQPSVRRTGEGSSIRHRFVAGSADP